MYFKVKQTKTNKSSEIFPPLLPKPTEECARAIPRGNKDQQKVPVLKKPNGFAPLEVISLWLMTPRGALYTCSQSTLF